MGVDKRLYICSIKTNQGCIAVPGYSPNALARAGFIAADIELWEWSIKRPNNYPHSGWCTHCWFQSILKPVERSGGKKTMFAPCDLEQRFGRATGFVWNVCFWLCSCMRVGLGCRVRSARQTVFENLKYWWLESATPSNVLPLPNFVTGVSDNSKDRPSTPYQCPFQWPAIISARDILNKCPIFNRAPFCVKFEARKQGRKKKSIPLGVEMGWHDWVQSVLWVQSMLPKGPHDLT